MKKKILIISMASGIVLTGIVLFIIFYAFSEKRPSYHILCMGDSLTESEFGYYPKHLLGLLKQKGIRVSVQTVARPGNTSGEYLAFLKKSGLLIGCNADMVILMLGTNDVRIDWDSTPLPLYIQNMKEIIHRIRSCSSSKGSMPVVFIATVPPILKIDLHTFSEISKTRVEEEINPAIREIAEDENINLLEVNHFFCRHPELLPGIHPRRKGYYALAKFIFDKILNFVEER